MTARANRARICSGRASSSSAIPVRIRKAGTSLSRERIPSRTPPARCPFAGHIRKAYPRDDRSESIPSLGEVTTQTHRLLRRGIPFGPASASTFSAPLDDTADRGLLFLAYQVSIVDQFEFVTRNWVNNSDFKADGAGHDPIIGQNADDPSRTRTFRLSLPGAAKPITTD